MAPCNLHGGYARRFPQFHPRYRRSPPYLPRPALPARRRGVRLPPPRGSADAGVLLPGRSEPSRLLPPPRLFPRHPHPRNRLRIRLHDGEPRHPIHCRPPPRHRSPPPPSAASPARSSLSSRPPPLASISASCLPKTSTSSLPDPSHSSSSAACSTTFPTSTPSSPSAPRSFPKADCSSAKSPTTTAMS